MPKVCPVCSATFPDENAFCPVHGTTLRAVELAEGLIGSVIADRYLVTDLLGEGGMGKVYLARHVRLPQQAAIKVLRSELARDPDAVARFTREASNASRIDDEHVARVYDFGETTDGTVYIAMEYVPGRTLKQLLAEGGPPAPARAVAIVRQIADALDAAHRLGIVHRDLKPDNVLVAEGPDTRDRVKVVDFGIAKALGADDRTITRTGFVVGTPDFMSPEQLAGGTVDARSDIYSLALVAYQCLTCALPFDSTTPERAMLARLTARPRPLIESLPAVPWPGEVQAVFNAALARDPAERTESALAFARQLRDAVRDWVGLMEGTSRFSTFPGVPSPMTATPTVPRRVGRARGELPRKGDGRGTMGRVTMGALALAAVAAVAVFVVARRTPGAHPAAAPPIERDTARGGGARATDSARTVRAPRAIAARTSSASAESTARVRAPVVEHTAPRAETAAASTERLAARHALDSLAAVLRDRDDEDTAREVANALVALIPRLGDANDRLRARMRLIDARVLSGDVPGACAVLQAATPTANTAAQRDEVRGYAEKLGCG